MNKCNEIRVSWFESETIPMGSYLNARSPGCGTILKTEFLDGGCGVGGGSRPPRGGALRL